MKFVLDVERKRFEDIELFYSRETGETPLWTVKISIKKYYPDADFMTIEGATMEEAIVNITKEIQAYMETFGYPK